MNEESKKVLEEIANRLDWNVNYKKEYITLGKYSPAGQDFSIRIDKKNTLEELAEEVWKRYKGYDVSAETYLWLGSDGHGKNGAPYDLGDIYEDRKCCKENLKELHDELYKEIL